MKRGRKKKYQVFVSFTAPESMYNEMKFKCENQNESMANFIRRAIDKELEFSEFNASTNV